MANMKSVIILHNKNILTFPTKPEKRFCNYTDKAECLLSEKWLANNILYQATISSTGNSDTKKFIT